jgi:hypothetical protein
MNETLRLLFILACLLFSLLFVLLLLTSLCVVVAHFSLCCYCSLLFVLLLLTSLCVAIALAASYLKVDYG